MRDDLKAALDAFDRVVASADGVVDPTALEAIAGTVRHVRDRIGYLGDTVVVAIAGGTGSGKSSLVNAFAGEVVSESGGMRPTTGLPLAWIPENPEPGLMRLLDDLGVDDRVGQDLYPWLALIDLPDTDSVVVDHRHTVESLLPRVDLVMWVIDPEKYQDRVFHQAFIEPLAAYHRQFIFVLNQIDRLEPDDVADIESDLVSSLRADGIPEPTIMTVAADPAFGPPIGVTELGESLADAIDVKRAVFHKLAVDLKEAATTLGSLPELSGAVGFEPRWEDVRSHAADMIANGDRRGAQAALSRFVDEIAAEIGGDPAEHLRSEASEATPAAVEVAYEASGAFRQPPTPSPMAWVKPVRWVSALAVTIGVVWAGTGGFTDTGLFWPVIMSLVSAFVWVATGVWSSRHRDRLHHKNLERYRSELTEPIGRHLDRHLGKPLRSVLRQRAGVTAAATELNLALAELERRLGLN